MDHDLPIPFPKLRVVDPEMPEQDRPRDNPTAQEETQAYRDIKERLTAANVIVAATLASGVPNPLRELRQTIVRELVGISQGLSYNKTQEAIAKHRIMLVTAAMGGYQSLVKNELPKEPTDAELIALIEDSGGRWVQDEFIISAPALMKLLRKLVHPGVLHVQQTEGMAGEPESSQTPTGD